MRIEHRWAECEAKQFPIAGWRDHEVSSSIIGDDMADAQIMSKGSCLCRPVSFEVHGALEHQPEACHCSQCRKQTGHFFVGVNVPRKNLAVHGDEYMRWYRSSEKVRRGFCSVCGSTLFWEPTIEGYEYTSVAMGAFEKPTGARLSKHTFVGDKGDYYDIDDGLPQSESY